MFQPIMTTTLKAKFLNWLRAYIAIWEATQDLGTGAYNDPINYAQDSLNKAYQNFTERYDLPKLSADELIQWIENLD